MERIIIPAVLILGLILAALLTKWANWYAWGQNREKREQMEKRMKERAAMRKEGQPGEKKKDG
ncbi:MAG: hypothetical protein HY751_12470 [Nitrospinae bacterium]|nr:hypothetical protein [Nitrospinota bacterium]